MKESQDYQGSVWGYGLPEKVGLYDPANEKDACGVGFVVSIQGEASHRIVEVAVKDVVVNMTHRGAVGCDDRDGDGAGVMTGIPHELFANSLLQEANIKLPEPGKYATGNVYLNHDHFIRLDCKARFEALAENVGLKIIHWRKVPRNNSVLGPSALAKEPTIEQPFIIVSDKSKEGDTHYFESRLYLLRKLGANKISLRTWFYICSLSTRVMTYKGLLNPGQVLPYYLDLQNKDYKTHFALVHSRFSTNTFPSWDRAQPMRWCAHNGEINSLRGNRNSMLAREGVVSSQNYKEEIKNLFPVIEEFASDSGAFDNVLELLIIGGKLTLPEAIMIMIPEAWQNNPHMPAEKKAFYEWASTIMEPWDGPALFTFSDGRYIGATLDRNGLRPARYYITTDGFMICASEVGTMKVDPKTVASKGRLQPGKMLLVDTQEGLIVDDDTLKMNISKKYPFNDWLQENKITMKKILENLTTKGLIETEPLDQFSVSVDPRLVSFGYSLETINLLIRPIVTDGKEALGSMGNDAALACLSRQPRPLFDYFQQLFAQVTNPPIDPIREAIVMSLVCFIGPEGNLLDVDPQQCHRFQLPSPILTLEEIQAIRFMDKIIPSWKVRTIDITWPKAEGIEGYVPAIQKVCHDVEIAINLGYKVAILSDKAVSKDRVALSSLATLGAVHHFLIRRKKRSEIALIVEAGDAREVHHMCVLLGYGADAICPYLVYDLIRKLERENSLKEGVTASKAVYNFVKACNDGILKVMSKMGISTLQSYKGAQTFEALGVGESMINLSFSGTASRIGGIGFDIIASEALSLHEQGFPSRNMTKIPGLIETGEYHWRDGGEEHINEPGAISNLQDAVRRKNNESYKEYSRISQNQIKNCTLRGMLTFTKSARPIPIDQVEPWTKIVKRFVTGAMSFGSISEETHTSIAIAMNRIGGKSNTGEGGEDPRRSEIDENGDTKRSAIKQIASARFGVTSHYLSDADELQIKLAQGAKPGEGGELPGDKVTEDIAAVRKSTPGVGLISPPPHHDIYSIEDLKQLIYDLKCSNPEARVSVKLVSEVGVGVVAAGVAKAKADHILISGHDGGTGASRWTGIKHAGLPWELGVAEAHQTLVLNNLRGRVVLQTDGQLKTGRDVAIACLLGAEEFGFATTPLIALGCIMMRKCHLNTCPVGVATQDPELRKKFEGKPEHVVNFFYMIAEELREIMAQLGFRSISDMVGRCDRLVVDEAAKTFKNSTIDLSSILTPAHTLREGAATYNIIKQDHQLEKRIDNILITKCLPSLDHGEKVDIEMPIINTDRAVGTTLSYHISKKYGEQGLPHGTINIKFFGSAGQSLGAFLSPGIFMSLEGDANDYVGKGLSGGRIAIFPPKESTFVPENNIIVGNVCLYGATSGYAFFRGIAAERFAVRNSGAIAVVEGCGDHGCEYMTGGRVVILGPTGRNFAAGMSGGIAYVLDPRNKFTENCNMEMVDLENLTDFEEIKEVRRYIEQHYVSTQSGLARSILDSWSEMLPFFIKVFPKDYKRVLLAQKNLEAKAKKPRLQQPTKEEPKIMDIEDALLDPAKLEVAVKTLDKLNGFKKYKRKTDEYRDPEIRIKDFEEINHRLKPNELRVQGARCMDCGVPFCQSETGCPVSNIIPKWNELVYQNQWRQAWERLSMTNNFPEFTGRVCPAPCEGACVLGINEQPVAIKSIECAIIDRAFDEGWVKATQPPLRTSFKVAIIGSGPAGLAAADQLNKAGHSVTVYERNDRIGGLLMYGIPNMKLDKKIVQRRVNLMAEEGVKFITNAHVGKNYDVNQIKNENNALLIATGATWPRDLPIPNRNLDGIFFAMDFLQATTQSLLNSKLQDNNYISAKGKTVIVIGGGDTGNDCIGTSIRHGAKKVVNFELLPEPTVQRSEDNPWPQFPRTFKIDYGHNEVKVNHGKDPREYCILSTEFVSNGEGKVKGINTIKVEWTKDQKGQWQMKKIPGSEQLFEADLILLAMGFLGPEDTILKQLNLQQDNRSNIKTTPSPSNSHLPNSLKTSYSTSQPMVFAAGDCRRGQSLVVWGINEGRMAAREIDNQLMGNTILPITGGLPVHHEIHHKLGRNLLSKSTHGFVDLS